MTVQVSQRGSHARAASEANPLTQLMARCRAEPLVLDDFCAELCPALEQTILGHMQTSRRSTKSLNVGGWKSGEDFFLWPDACVQELRRRVVDELGMPRPVGWAMVNRGGSHHPRHQHRAAMITGLFFVTAGSEDAITPTIFECPGERDARGRLVGYELEVEPHPGRIVISRGETWHRVPAYSGELPRITVAFDVRR